LSTIKVTNIQATGETASRSVSGVAAAWVNFNGTGTIAARDSLNLSSLTDNGTGDYDISVSSAFGNTNYQIVSCGTKDSGESLPRIVLYSGGTKTSSAINITVELDTGAHQDNDDIYVTHFGDLA
jgi:hypothetical protein